MKINMWIRMKDGVPTLRLDCKYESQDTPVIQRYGRKLMDAIEGKGRKHDETRSDTETAQGQS